MLSKNLFLLTDGKAHDMTDALQIFRGNYANFRVHCVGIGNEIESNFLSCLSNSTHGKFEVVENSSDLISVVIDILNIAVQPYITNVKFTCNYPDLFNYSSNKVFYHDELIDFGFVSEKPIDLSDLEISMSYYDPFKNKQLVKRIEVAADLFNFPNGEELSKMVVGNSIKNSKRMDFLDIALKYQILSEKTALYCEDKENKLVVPMTKLEINLDDYGVCKSRVKSVLAKPANKSSMPVPGCEIMGEKFKGQFKHKIRSFEAKPSRTVKQIFIEPIRKVSNSKNGTKPEKFLSKPTKVNSLLNENAFDLFAPVLNKQKLVKGVAYSLPTPLKDNFSFNKTKSKTLSTTQVLKMSEEKHETSSNEGSNGISGIFLINNINSKGYWVLDKQKEFEICRSLGKISEDLINMFKDKRKEVVNAILCLFFINQFLRDQHRILMVIIGRCKNFLCKEGVEMEDLFEHFRVEAFI